MQVGGIGNGSNYSSAHTHTHMVSDCVHEESSGKKNAGAMVSRKAQTAEAQVNSGSQGENFSFFQWAGDGFRGAKKLFGRIWGAESETKDASVKGISEAGTSAKGDYAGKVPGTERTEKNTELQMAELTGQLMLPAEAIGNRQYSAVMGAQKTEESGTLFRRLKYRVQSVTDFLKKRFASAGKQDFHAGYKTPQENIRKQKSYTQNGVIVDSVQPVDSHLMDSYDRRGAYSKISTKR